MNLDDFKAEHKSELLQFRMTKEQKECLMTFAKSKETTAANIIRAFINDIAKHQAEKK